MYQKKLYTTVNCCQTILPEICLYKYKSPALEGRMSSAELCFIQFQLLIMEYPSSFEPSLLFLQALVSFIYIIERVLRYSTMRNKVGRAVNAAALTSSGLYCFLSLICLFNELIY